MLLQLIQISLTLKRVRNDLCLERVWRRKAANLRRLPSPPKSNRRHFESATADEKSFFWLMVGLGQTTLNEKTIFNTWLIQVHDIKWENFFDLWLDSSTWQQINKLFLTYGWNQAHGSRWVLVYILYQRLRVILNMDILFSLPDFVDNDVNRIMILVSRSSTNASNAFTLNTTTRT